jgi:hypothetical protein
LLPVLSQGRAGISAMTDEFDELGGALDQETIDAMAGMTREVAKIKQALTGALMPAVRGIIENLGKFVEKIRPAIDKIKELAGNSHLVRAALITFGVVAVGVAGAIVVAYAPVIAAFAVLVGAAILVGFAIDDLITTFEGGDSVVRRFVDGLFTVGTTASAVEELKDAWAGLMSLFESGGDVMGPVIDAFAPVVSLFQMLGVNMNHVKDALGVILQLLVRLNPLTGLIQTLGNVGRPRRAAQEQAAARSAAATRRSAGFNALPQGTGNRLLAPETPSGFRFDRATVTASPTATAQASAQGGASSRTVNTRAQVTIQGLVEDSTIQRRIRDGVTEALNASNEQAAEALDRTSGE